MIAANFHATAAPRDSSSKNYPSLSLRAKIHQCCWSRVVLGNTYTAFAKDMYHLDGSPSAETSLLSDLYKAATAKCQALLKKEQQMTASRPSVSRSSTQLSVPKSKA